MRTPGLVLILALVVAACADRRQHDPGRADTAIDRAEIGARWSAVPGRPVALVGPRSRIDILVYRAGRLASLGHNHVLEVTDLGGRLRHLDDGGGLAELHFRPDRLRVDDPAARAWAGAEFAANPAAGAVDATRDNLLGSAVLDAAAWPQIQILARVDTLGATAATADMVLTVRGVSRRYAVPVVIASAEGEIRIDGAVQVRQRDFGIEPFAVLGGALQVRDEVEVKFRIVAQNTGGPMW